MASGGDPGEEAAESAARAASSEADPAEADPLSVAREIALRRLSVRARSRKELEKDLAQREVPKEVAAEVLDRFSEVGLVDDAAFAAQWVESRGGRSGASRLRQELRQKGIADEHIAQAIDARDDDADLENARTLAQRKASTMRGLELVVQQRRLSGVLARRGYSNAVIRRVLNEVLSGSADGDD